MGHLRKSKVHQLRRVAIGLTVASSIGWSLALVLDHTEERPDTWTQCFNDARAAAVAGFSVDEAIITVQAERRTDQRRIRAHERALQQLGQDRRWENPEQRPWLELAVAQTNAQITDLQSAEEQAGDTEGCLESYD
jgi:hypothetical protein